MTRDTPSTVTKPRRTAGTASSNGANGSRAAGVKAHRALNQKEDQIHKAVVSHLRYRAQPDVLWLHPPNGEARNRVTGAKLVGMGVLPGAADLLLWHQGRAYALEIKRSGGRVQDSQHAFAARFAAAGGTYAVVYGLDDALGVLARWGIIAGSADAVTAR